VTTTALRNLLPDNFYLGNIYHTAPGAMAELGDIAAQVCDSITPENQGKWVVIHPERDRYNFQPMDDVITFAEQNPNSDGTPMRVRGHTLMWHNQNPQWVLDMFAPGAATDEELRAVLRDHIETVVGRYKGKIAQWDVANEIFTDEGEWRDNNPWVKRFGPQIIGEAFRIAHAVDPECKLYLNDYNVERIDPKSDAYYEFIQTLLAQGVPIDGFGIQGHLALQYGYPDTLVENMQRFADLGLDIEITELDIRMPITEDGELQNASDLQVQADWYARIFRDAFAVPNCTGITIWGIGDKYSWIPWLFKGEGAATLFDNNAQPKPAYDAIEAVLRA